MLDLTRSVITVNLGIRDVDPTATFEAGSVAQLSEDGKLTVATSSAFGVFKWNKTSAIYGRVVDEAVTLTGTVPSSLEKANLVAGSVKVTNSTGTIVYADTDYTVNTTNGTIARTGDSSIPDGATVKVSYTYNLTTEEIKTRGTNYMNSFDDTAGHGKMTVITGYAELYTDQFDTSKSYTIGAQLYVNNGVFTTEDTGVAFGKVISVPTASDPFLGVQINQ